MKNFKRNMFLYVYVSSDANISEKHTSLLTVLVKSITKTRHGYSRWKYITNNNLYHYPQDYFIHFAFRYIGKNEKNFYNV